VLVDDNNETELRREPSGDEIGESSASDMLLDVNCIATRLEWETITIGGLGKLQV
jgi:hypothetical protein